MRLGERYPGQLADALSYQPTYLPAVEATHQTEGAVTKGVESLRIYVRAPESRPLSYQAARTTLPSRPKHATTSPTKSKVKTHAPH